MDINHRTELLNVCAALSDAGIWLTISKQNTLIIGPTALVKRHPNLLDTVRLLKVDLMHLIEDCLAHSVFGTNAEDSRFDREECPDCHQPCFIVLSPRRLGVHRLPDGKTICPGSDRAQQATAEVIMQAFLDDRCLARGSAVITWYALRGALEAWCLERTFFLPPRPFLLAWLDAHFPRHGDDEQPMWAGLTLTLPEWGLETVPETEPPAKVPRVKRPKKAVLRT